MFTEITWAMYLRVTAASLFIYYTLLVITYYLPQIRAAATGGGIDIRPLRSHSPAPANTTSEANNQNLTPKGEFNEPLANDYEIIEEMVDRVKGVLKEAAMGDDTEESVTESLKKIINDYPLLSKSTFRPSINEFIATESQQHGYSSLNEAAIDQLWQKA